MYKIGLFSKMNKVTVKTLRHYDEIGLLKPSRICPENGYRYYTSAEMLRLHRILALKQIGFSLNEIIQVMDKNISAERMIDYLEGKQDAITKILEDEKAKLLQVQAYLKILRQEAMSMSYAVLLKELPEVIVASMRTIIPDYEAFNLIYPQMGKYMKEQNCKCAEPGYCFTLYHDGEYKDRDIDVEICEAVEDFAADSAEIKFKKIEAVEIAAYVYHKGPYGTIGLAYGAVMKWIEENNFEVIGLPRESYLDGCWNKEIPEDWLTEVQVPVRRNK